MLRGLLFHPDAPSHGSFRLRGREVSRLEAFSDAVFGFALTLLVISLNPPTTFEGMVDVMKGAPAFAICFVILVHYWYMHYSFFRRYGLNDFTTFCLNGVLLFVVLLYVYPLRYMFVVVVWMVGGIGPEWVQSRDWPVTLHQSRPLFYIFGAGYVATYAIFALLYLHAWRRRRALDLSPLETHDTVSGIVINAAIASVGVASVLLAAAAPMRWVALAGWVYCAAGPVGGLTGYLRGRGHRRLAAGRTRG